MYISSLIKDSIDSIQKTFLKKMCLYFWWPYYIVQCFQNFLYVHKKFTNQFVGTCFGQWWHNYWNILFQWSFILFFEALKLSLFGQNLNLETRIYLIWSSCTLVGPSAHPRHLSELVERFSVSRRQDFLSYKYFLYSRYFVLITCLSQFFSLILNTFLKNKQFTYNFC